MKLLLLFWISITGYADSTQPKPLVLQWEVSHVRNTDQISLIFRKNKVEWVTNSSQKASEARLGHFSAPLTPQTQVLKDKVQKYYHQFKKTVPVSSLITDPRFPKAVEPHDPVLRINEENIPHGHPAFQALADIIHGGIPQKKLECVACALYKARLPNKAKPVQEKSGKPPTAKTAGDHHISSLNKSDIKILRILKRKTKTVEEKTFSAKDFNCVLKGKAKMECVDPQFGIFEVTF